MYFVLIINIQTEQSGPKRLGEHLSHEEGANPERQIHSPVVLLHVPFPLQLTEDSQTS